MESSSHDDELATKFCDASPVWRRVAVFQFIRREMMIDVGVVRSTGYLATLFHGSTDATHRAKSVRHPFIHFPTDRQDKRTNISIQPEKNNGFHINTFFFSGDGWLTSRNWNGIKKFDRQSGPPFAAGCLSGWAFTLSTCCLQEFYIFFNPIFLSFDTPLFSIGQEVLVSSIFKTIPIDMRRSGEGGGEGE